MTGWIGAIIFVLVCEAFLHLERRLREVERTAHSLSRRTTELHRRQDDLEAFVDDCMDDIAYGDLEPGEEESEFLESCRPHHENCRCALPDEPTPEFLEHLMATEWVLREAAEAFERESESSEEA